MSATRARSCSSPTTRPRSASARSPRCTRPRTSSSRSSAAACATAARPGAEPLAVPRRPPEPARRRRGSPRPAASAPSSPGSRAASRCPPPTPARARARVPFVLWATIWRHPRTAAHALSYLPLRHIYRARRRDRHVRPARVGLRPLQGRRAARWSRRRRASTTRSGRAPATPARHAPFQVMFAGRLEREKGLPVLLQAWRASGLQAPEVALYWSATARSEPGPSPPARSARRDRSPPEQVRNFYAGSDVVVVPSVPTRDFLEPWGLVVNEAFDQGVPVIATTAVGRRRRRARPQRGDRARRPRRRRGRARAPRCGACTTTPRCARGSAPRAARRSRAATRTPTGRPG